MNAGQKQLLTQAGRVPSCIICLLPTNVVCSRMSVPIDSALGAEVSSARFERFQQQLDFICMLDTDGLGSLWRLESNPYCLQS